MATTIWLVRHGETTSNADGIYQGQLDVALNARGEEQARLLGDYLRDVRFDAVYASDLERAARTAELVVGVPRERFCVDPDLRERHYGALQGVRYDEAAAVLAAHGIADAAGHDRAGVRGAALPGGETLARMRNRARRFIHRLDAEHPPASTSQVLVVSHGGMLRVLLTTLLGLPAGARLHFSFTNCGVSRVVRSETLTVLDLHNHVCRLDD